MPMLKKVLSIYKETLSVYSSLSFTISRFRICHDHVENAKWYRLPVICRVIQSLVASSVDARFFLHPWCNLLLQVQLMHGSSCICDAISCCKFSWCTVLHASVMQSLVASSVDARFVLHLWCNLLLQVQLMHGSSCICDAISCCKFSWCTVLPASVMQSLVASSVDARFFLHLRCNLLLQVQLMHGSSCIRDAISCCKFSWCTVLPASVMQSLVASSVDARFFLHLRCNLLLQVQLMHGSSCIRDAISCCKFSWCTVLPASAMQSLVASSVDARLFLHPWCNLLLQVQLMHGSSCICDAISCCKFSWCTVLPAYVMQSLVASSVGALFFCIRDAISCCKFWWCTVLRISVMQYLVASSVDARLFLHLWCNLLLQVQLMHGSSCICDAISFCKFSWCTVLPASVMQSLVASSVEALFFVYPWCNLLLQVQWKHCISCIRDAISCCKFSWCTVLPVSVMQYLVASSVEALFFLYPWCNLLLQVQLVHCSSCIRDAISCC